MQIKENLIQKVQKMIKFIYIKKIEYLHNIIIKKSSYTINTNLINV